MNAQAVPSTTQPLHPFRREIWPEWNVYGIGAAEYVLRRVTRSFVRTALLSMVLLAASALPTNAGEYWAGQAARAFDQENWSYSLTCWNRHLTTHRSCGLALNRRGWCHYKLGNYRQALRDISAALEYGDFSEVMGSTAKERRYAYMFRGDTCLKLDKHEQAIADYTRALQSEPNAYPKHWVIYTCRGSAYQRLGHFELALEDYDQAIRMKPDYAMAAICRCTALMCMGRPDLAAEEAERANRRVSRTGTGLTYIAVHGYLAYCQMNRDEEAKRFLGRIAARCDQSEWPFPLVDFLRGRLTGKALFANAVDSDKMTEAQAVLGLRYVLSGRPEDARKNLRWTADNGTRDFLEVDLAVAELDREVFGRLRPIAAKPNLPDLEELPALFPELKPLGDDN